MRCSNPTPMPSCWWRTSDRRRCEGRRAIEARRRRSWRPGVDATTCACGAFVGLSVRWQMPDDGSARGGDVAQKRRALAHRARGRRFEPGRPRARHKRRMLNPAVLRPSMASAIATTVGGTTRAADASRRSEPDPREDRR